MSESIRRYGGRCITGPDYGAFLASLFFILVPSSLTVAFDIRYLITNATNGWMVTVIVGVLYVWLQLLTVGSLLRATWTDPGIIPRPDKEVPIPDEGASVKEVTVNGRVVTIKFCLTCRIWRPPRAAHCPVCNNCVENFDHHCPWVGTCIGRQNYRWFVWFVTLVMLDCLATLGMNISHLVLLSANGATMADAIQQTPSSLVCMVLSAVFLLSAGGLACYHYRLAAQNFTTREDFKRDASKPATMGPSPYRRGGCNDFYAVVCAPDRQGFMGSEATAVVADFAAETQDEEAGETSAFL